MKTIMRTSLLFIVFALLNLQVLFSQDNLSIDYLDQKNTIEVSVFPNPVQDILQINSTQKIDLVKLYNKRGEVVFQAIPQNNQIELSNLQPGFYLLSAYVDGEKLKKRIIKKV